MKKLGFASHIKYSLLLFSGWRPQEDVCCLHKNRFCRQSVSIQAVSGGMRTEPPMFSPPQKACMSCMSGFKR